jgi:primosomal protein N'
MYVIHVIPLIRATTVESLSYFSGKTYDIGTIVNVPIRGKQYRAIVTHAQEVAQSKASIRSAGFALRKLPEQTSTPILSPTLRKTAEILAATYPSTAGALLYHLLPPEIRTGVWDTPPQHSAGEANNTHTVSVLTARFDERLDAYQAHIREQFAHRGSVVLVVPIGMLVPRIAAAITAGIRERVIELHAGQKKHERDSAYSAWVDTSVAKVLVTTPSYAYIERVDCTSTIIESSAHRQYVGWERPYLDHRSALLAHATATNRSVILGDTVPRIEDESARRAERYQTWGVEAKRIAFPSELSIIKMKDGATPNTPFKLFSDRLVTSCERVLEGRGHVFLYGARRGLAPVVTCIDCQHIFRCPDSHTPYSLLRTVKNGVEERWFVSSTSGARVRAADVCPVCGSWRLRERGIGIQHVYDEWKERVPNYPVILFDHTTATTHSKAAALVKDFYTARAAVLIGTTMALPYLDTPVTTSAIVSLDAARTIPSWRADEYLFRLLLTLREHTEREVIVQTRTEPDPLVTYATRGAIERFYDDELALRAMLHYPPDARLILCSWYASPATHTFETQLDTDFRVWNPERYTNPHSTTKKILKHALFRIFGETRKRIPELLTLMRALPPFVKVEIDPDRIV